MINDKHTGAGGKAACSGFVLRAIPPRRASAAGFCIPPRKKAGERRRFLCAAAQKKLYKPARMLYNRTRARAHGRFVRYGAANSGALAKLAIALHWQCRDHRFESGMLHQRETSKTRRFRGFLFSVTRLGEALPETVPNFV